MTDICFQDIRTLWPVIPVKHQKRKDPLLQIIGIHLKPTGTFPDIQKFIHRSKPEFHQIHEDHFIIDSLSVYMRGKCDQLFVFRTITADDHTAYQLQKSTLLYSFKSKCFHHAHSLRKQSPLDQDLQKGFPVDHGIFPIIHHLQTGIQIFSLHVIPIIIQDLFADQPLIFIGKRR